MEWNKVIYEDCMNEENGLPTLEDKSVDYAIFDHPFGINYKAKFTKDNYEDKDEIDYSLLFKELRRITNAIIIYCGIQNEEMWYEIEKPKGKAYLLKKNSMSGGKISKLNCVYPILFYGNFNRIKRDYFEYFAYNGFLRGLNHISNLIHPCPLNYNFWEDLISQLKPSSVIDPFMGSGTTAEVCTKLGIPWLGYELNEVYSQDINKRLKNCKVEPKQIGLEAFQ